MANGAIFNTAIGQQFGGNNRKSSTLINTNNGNRIDTEVTPEATPKQVAEATPQYRLNKEKVLDDSLRNRGLTVTATAKEDQTKYWNGLSKEQQDQMTQFYNDGYSFDGARTLLEQIYGKEPQSLKVKRAGEAKGSDTWVGAIQDSTFMKILDRVNLKGKATEYLMKYEQQATQGAQNWVNEKLGVNENSTWIRDKANKNLKNRIDNLSPEKVKEYTDKFNEDSARGKARRSVYGTVENYIEEHEKGLWEDLLNIGTYESPAKTLPGDSKFENFINKYGFQGDNGIAWDRIVANSPRSLIDLATASLYAQTNKLDNLLDLAYLFTTKEGLEIVAEQYGSLEKFQETLISDPFGTMSDIFDAKDMISRAKSRQKKIQGALNTSKINAKKNEILKLASDIAKEQEANEGKNTVNTLDNIGKLDKLIKEKDNLEQKKTEIDESKKKWDERAEQASNLSDLFNIEPVDNAILGYLAEKGGIGKSIAYWYSLTQKPLDTIWRGLTTEKEVEQTAPQTLDDLDEGKEPEKTTTTVETKVTPGLVDTKAVQNVGEVWKRIRDKWEERTTGLTPDMKARIQQNPYVKAYWEQIKATIQDEGLSNQEQIIEEQFLEEIGNELLARIEKEEERVEETGIMYNKIRNLPQTFDFTPTAQGIANIFDRAGITIRPDGSLFFRNWSEAMTTDRNHAQILWNLMQQFINGQALTASQFLDLRAQLKAIENYKKGMDPTSAGKSAMLARQLRNEINKVAHKEIPGLNEIDAQYHKQISYLQQLKKDITYAQGPNSGKVRSNFYSIIRNINSANRKQYAGIIAGIFPEIKDRVEAVRLMPKLIKAYQKNSGLLQSVVNMPKLLSAAQLASGDGFIKSAMTLLIGQFVEEGLIRPVDKTLRQATIDEVISQLDPIAKLKLEEAIKNAQDGQKLTEEEQMVLQEVTNKIAQSIEEYRENLPKLPEPKPDVIDEEGNVTLGRGQPQTAEPQRKSIIEIQLHKPEAKAEEIQKIQEENNVDQQTAEKIEDSLQAFLQQMGADNGSVNVEQIDYNNFSTPTLNELRASDRMPKTEKEKIEYILKERLDQVEEGEWEKMDKYFAVKIDNLNAEEQRIGKVGKNKVNKSVSQQQEANWTKRREALIKEIEQFYYNGDPDSSTKAEEKFRELEATPRDVIESYKKSQNYIYESAERELLNRYLKEWDKQPKFTKNLSTRQADVRAEFIDNVKPAQGYEVSTTEYNDRYTKTEDGKVVDRGAITYLDNGKIQIIAQSLEGFIESGIMNYLPDETIVIESGNDVGITIGEIRESMNGEINESKYVQIGGTKTIDNEANIIEELGVTNPQGYTKFNGTLTNEQKAEGRELWDIATTRSDSNSTVTDEEVDIARKKIIILNQQIGYMEALGLDQNTVNERIESWTTYEKGAKEISDKAHEGVEKEYQWLGITNLSQKLGDVINESALNSLVKKIESVNGQIGKAEQVREMVNIILALNTHISYKLLGVEFTNNDDSRLKRNDGDVSGFYVQDIDKILVGAGYEWTLEHEIGHYVDYLWGREIYGNSRDRALSNGGYYGAIPDPEVRAFAEEFFQFVSGLDNNLYKATREADEKRIKEGKNKYWTANTEKFARFVQSFYGWTKHVAENGVDPNSVEYQIQFISSEEADKYQIKDYMKFIELLQKKAKLDASGKLYTAETSNKTGVSKYNGVLAKMKQDKLIERTEEEKAKLGGMAVKFIQDLDVNFGNGYGIDQIDFIVNALKSYKPQMKEWYKSFKENFKPLGNRGYTFDPKQVIENQAEYITDDLIDLYRSIENIANRENFVEGLGYYLEGLKKNGNRSVIGNAVKKFVDKHEPLNINYENSEYEEPLRTWLIDHPLVTVQGLIDSYSPDPIEWKENISGFRAPSAKDLTELKKILKNISDNITPEATGFFKHPIRGERASRLVYKYQIDRTPKLVKERLKKQVSDLWQGILDPMGNNVAYTMNFDKGLGSVEAMNKLSGEIFSTLGETYVENISQWHDLANDRIRDFIKTEGIGTPKTWDIVPEEKLHQINAKLREIFSIPIDWLELEEFDFDPNNSTRNAWLRDLILNAYMNYQGANPEAPEMIEKTKQLVALSNMSKENLEKQVKGFEGKSPMPSIAVTDINVPHVTFGDITLVFDKNTVDPEADSRNVLYASDAATPMFPDDIYTEGGRIEYGEIDPIYDKMMRGVKDERATKEVNPNTVKNILLTEPKNLGYLDEEMEEYGISEMANAMTNMLYDETYDETGKDLTDEEFKYWYEQFYNVLNDHTPRKMLPAKYFNGALNYGDMKAVVEASRKLADMVPEKGRQVLEDDGYVKEDKPGEKSRMMNKFEDGIFTEFADEIEGIEDRPNREPHEAGQNLRDTLVNKYGFKKEDVTPILEDLFGRLDPEERFEYDTANTTDVAEQIVEWIDEAGSSLMVEGIRDGKYSIEDYGITEEEFMSGEEWHTGAVGIICDIIYNHAKGYLDDNYKFQWDKKQYDKVYKDIKNEIEKFIPENNDLDLDSLIKKAIGEEPSGGPKPRPATPENIVIAMKQNRPQREVVEGGLRDIVGMEGKKFSSLEDVRKKNLFDTTHGGWTEDIKDLEKRYDTLTHEIFKEYFMNEELDVGISDVRIDIRDAYRSNPHTEKQFRELLEELDLRWKEVPDIYLKQIMDVIEMGKEVPVRFSESKPERVVDLFKEVKYIIAPMNQIKQVNNIVRGTPLEGKVRGYQILGKKSDRIRAIKKLQKQYGDIFFSMAGSIFPIASLLRMAEKIGGGDDDDQDQEA